MAGSPTFSTGAADTLVSAYLAQPEGNRDLRKVLAQAQVSSRENTDLALVPGSPRVPVAIRREIAAMSQSQAYELLRSDTRYQPTTTEKADELCAENLEQAREIIASEKEKPPYLRDVTRLKEAQSLIGMVEWQKHRYRQKAENGSSGLAGLVG